MLVLILRSAHAQALPQARTRVSASRRMRTATTWPSCFETHRSALGLWKRLRSRPAAMLLSMRARGKHQPVAARNKDRRNSIVSGLLFTMDGATPTCRAARRASDHLLGLVVGLAVTPQRGRLGAGIKLFQSGRDLGVLALEQAVAGKIALDQERPELVDVEHPDRLRQPEFLEPINAGDALDAASEQRAGAVSHRGEIDRVVGHERLAVDLRRHSALADDDVAAGEVKPAVEPLREAERGGRGDGADGVAAVGVDRRRRRAVEVDKAERISPGRHAGAVLDRALVDALARGEDAATEIGDRADLKLAQIVGRRRQGEMDGVELRHCHYSAAAGVGTPNFSRLPSGSVT